jgi:hypothetical protein
MTEGRGKLKIYMLSIEKKLLSTVLFAKIRLENNYECSLAAMSSKLKLTRKQLSLDS